MTSAEPWCVCSWFTPNYAHWAEELKGSLEALQVPHDIVEADVRSSWERATMRKPLEVLKAMDRHPEETIIFLDADCTVHGDLSPLAALDCDVAFCMRAKTQGGRRRLRPLSGTLVIKPTEGARLFMCRWRRLSFAYPYASIDEDVLSDVLCNAEGVRFQVIGPDWSGRSTQAVVRHAYASKTAAKISKAKRIFGRALLWKGRAG